MIKASIIALAAVAALGFFAQPSVAQRNICIAASCAGGSSNPSNPDNPDNPDNPGGNGPDLPIPPLDEQRASAQEVCNAALHKLKRIQENLVVAFDNEPGVTVVPVCNNGPARKAELDSSQALPLQNAIAKNAALMGPLDTHGFKSDDVVGVVLRQGVATLYVHKGS